MPQAQAAPQHFPSDLHLPSISISMRSTHGPFLSLKGTREAGLPLHRLCQPTRSIQKQINTMRTTVTLLRYLVIVILVALVGALAGWFFFVRSHQSTITSQEGGPP